jgi:hypothetical protein
MAWEWTAERDAILRRMWGNERLGTIADGLGCSYFMVARRAHQLGLQRLRGGVRKGKCIHTTFVRSLRPMHVQGEPGDREWFESCDAAFREAIGQAHTRRQEGGEL